MGHSTNYGNKNTKHRKNMKNHKKKNKRSQNHPSIKIIQRSIKLIPTSPFFHQKETVEKTSPKQQPSWTATGPRTPRPPRAAPGRPAGRAAPGLRAGGAAPAGPPRRGWWSLVHPCASPSTLANKHDPKNTKKEHIHDHPWPPWPGHGPWMPMAHGCPWPMPPSVIRAKSPYLPASPSAWSLSSILRHQPSGALGAQILRMSWPETELMSMAIAGTYIGGTYHV